MEHTIRVHGEHSRKGFRLMCLCIFFLFSAKAQITTWNHTQYTTRNGLPSNSIRNCVQDNDGFLWIATESGLCRFDGDEFKPVFHVEHDSTSIPADYINAIAMAESGHLLVSTLNGFFIMNTRTYKGKTIRVIKKKGEEEINENNFTHIYVNKQKKLITVLNTHHILFLNAQYQVIQCIKYPQTNAKKSQLFYTEYPCFLPNGDIIFWSTHNRQFEYYHYATKKFVTCSSSSNDAYKLLGSIQDIQKFNWDQEGNLWYTRNGNDSFFCCDMKHKKIHRRELKGKLHSINWTSNIHFTNRRTILMPYANSDANELYEIPIDSVLQKPSYTIHPTSFSGFTVASASLFIDKDQNWWISSLDGLYFLKKDFKYFERIDLPVPYRKKFDWQYVSAIQLLNPETMLVTTLAEHCFLYNLRNNSMVSFLDSVPLSNAWNHCMYGIIPLDYDRFLIDGCRDYLFEKGKLRYPFIPKNAFEQLLVDHECWSAIREGTNAVWVSLSDIGLVRYDYDKRTYKVFSPEGTFGSDKFRLVNFDQKGNLYFAQHQSNIVWKYTVTTKSFESIPIPYGENTVGSIRDIAVDENDRIYINTHQQLLMFDRRTQQKQVLGMQEGLQTNVLNALYYYKNNLYLSSNKGLGIWNTQRRVLRLFTEADGIVDNATSNSIITDTVTQRIYIGGKGCVYRIQPDSAFAIPVPAKLMIDKIWVNNKPRNNDHGYFQLSFRENNIRIDLSSIDFYSGKNRTYYYALREKGKSTEWNVSQTKQINLMNLSPGDYQLEFRSADANHQWSLNTANLSFRINLPWYRQTWFYGLLLIVLGSSIYLIYLNKIRQIKRIEGIRSKLSRDLHDDIGSTLSSISILSNTAIRSTASQPDRKVMQTLQKINERSQRLLQNMNDIIWNIKPENDSFDELLSRMRSYASTVFEAKGIVYTLNFPKDARGIRFDMQAKSNLYLIFKEAVNNIVKYAQTDRVDIVIEWQYRKLSMKIEDYGVGFKRSDLEHIGGLSNMEFRAKEMNADILIQSEMGKGTRVELTCKLN